MNTNRQILLYGIGGAEKAYAVLSYYCIFEDATDIVPTIRRAGLNMMAANPSIQTVYMISNRRGLKRDFKDAIRRNSIEGWAIFKDLLEREGMKVQL